jgi:phosphocarrier protein
LELRHKICLVNRAGLHARPCHAIVSAALAHGGDVRVRANGREVNAKSILELMTLNAGCGTELEFVVRGGDGQAVMTRLAELVQGGFGEE